MRLAPMLPGGWYLVGGLALVLVAALGWSARTAFGADAEPGARSGWLRRAALALVAVLLAAGPWVPKPVTTSVSTVEIYMVVDRTGSMAAEDWAGGPQSGGGTRLDGVRSDLRAIRQSYPDAQFSIIALDTNAYRELPLTSDVDAVDAWIDSLSQEVTNKSSGSSLERALPLLTSTLTAARENAPQDSRVLYILSDGEATDDGAGARKAQEAGATWQALEPLVDAGAVLGYGTAQGGSMREFTGAGTTSDQPYITDPATGQPAVSVPDTEELTTVAESLGIGYYQRTGGSQDEATSAFTDLDVSASVADGRTVRTGRRYVVWPLGIVAVALATWELAAVLRGERGLRRLVAAGGPRAASGGRAAGGRR